MAREVQERLDVLGGLRIAAGAGAGKVLTSDPSGNAAWAALPTATVARVWRSAADTVVGNAVSKIPFDTIGYDLGNNYSIASGRYVCPATGYYHVFANLTATAPGAMQAILYKNGAQNTAGTLVSNAYGSTVADLIYCQAGDYLEAYLYANQGSNVTLNTSKQDFTFMTVQRVA